MLPIPTRFFMAAVVNNIRRISRKHSTCELGLHYNTVQTTLQNTVEFFFAQIQRIFCSLSSYLHHLSQSVRGAILDLELGDVHLPRVKEGKTATFNGSLLRRQTY